MFAKGVDKDIYDISHLALEEPREELYYKHMHTYCELLLFIEGDMDFCIDGDFYRLKPYDLLLIPRETYHYGKLRSTARYENYVIDFYDTLLPPKKGTQLFCPPRVFNISGDPQILRYFRLLDTYYDSYEAEDFKLCAACLIREILIYCCYAQRISSPVIRGQNPIIQRILDCIDNHLEETLDASVLADRLNLSRSHIQNLFSQHMQIGLKQYIMKKKIFAANKDLSAGALPTEVASKYRFNDYSTFYRLYKKTFGYSPASRSHHPEE